MAPGNADLIRPIYEEWGQGNWRPCFDGIEIHPEGAHVYELRDAKVVRLEIFATRAKALQSVQRAP